MLKYVTILCFCMIGWSMQGQTVGELIDGLKSSGNSVDPILSSQVLLCMDNDEEMLSKSETVKRLRKFINSHPNLKVSGVHRGNSRNKNSNYSVANLISADMQYRVFMYKGKEGSRSVIKEIRIELE